MIMIFKKNWVGVFFSFIFIQSILFPVLSKAQEPVEVFTLKQAIESAIKVNLGLKSTKEETAAAQKDGCID